VDIRRKRGVEVELVHPFAGPGGGVDAQRPGHVQQRQLGGVTMFLFRLGRVELRVVAGDDGAGHPDRRRSRFEVRKRRAEVENPLGRPTASHAHPVEGQRAGLVSADHAG